MTPFGVGGTLRPRKKKVCKGQWRWTTPVEHIQNESIKQGKQGIRKVLHELLCKYVTAFILVS